MTGANSAAAVDGTDAAADGTDGGAVCPVIIA
jgi:hypothetical protein